MLSPFCSSYVYFLEYCSGQKNFWPAKNLAEREDGLTLCVSGGLGRVWLFLVMPAALLREIIFLLFFVSQTFFCLLVGVEVYCCP